MVLRMCKVLAIPQSRSQSPRVTLVQRNKSNTDSGNEIGHTAELVRVPQCLYWCGMFFFSTSYAIVYNNNNNNNDNNNNNNIFFNFKFYNNNNFIHRLKKKTIYRFKNMNY